MRDTEPIEHHGLARNLARWAVARYYPHIEIDGGERIPQSGPVLLCANHANALIDPLIVGIAAKRPVRFMAKAPLFDTPLIGSTMRSLGMVPAFRGMDDKRQVRRNLESLDTGASVLIDRQAMGIFPEGMSTDAAHVVKVRSGAARMALQAVDQGAEEVCIVPIGIAYERKEQFRSAVLVRVAEPIVAAEFLAAEDGNVPRARRAITAELDARIKGVAIHLDNPDWEPWLDDLETLVPILPEMPRSPAGALRQRKRIAEAINYFWETDRPRAESLAADIKRYRGAVEAAGLRVDSDVLKMPGLGVLLRLLWKLAWLAVLFVPAVLGTVHHIVPFIIVRRVAAWMDKAGKMTTATHKMMVGIPIYILWLIGITTVLWIYRPWVAWTWLVIAPFAGVLALHYWREARRVATLLYHEALALLHRKSLVALRRQLAQLRERLTRLSGDFEKSSPPDAAR